MAYGSAIAMIYFEDFIIYTIIIIVVSISCYYLIKRCIIDYNNILILTSNNVVVPVELFHNRPQVATRSVELPRVPDLPNR